MLWLLFTSILGYFTLPKYLAHLTDQNMIWVQALVGLIIYCNLPKIGLIWYLLLILVGIIYWLPKSLIRFIDQQYQYVHFFIPNTSHSPDSWGVSPDQSRKKIVLTFDDVPYHQTESFRQILDLLRVSGQKAIFFVIGSYVNRCPDSLNLLVRAVQEGHTLANHGFYNHYHCFRDAQTIRKEILDCQNIINYIYLEAKVIPPTIKFFRPGGGLLSSSILKACQDQEITPLLGSVYPHDPQVPFPELNLWYLQKHIDDNDIIILHDRHWTPEMLEKLLLWLNKNHFHSMDYRSLENCFGILEREVPWYNKVSNQFTNKFSKWWEQPPPYPRQNNW